MPDAQLRRLGPLSRLYTVQELSQWQVTSADTLCALLNPSDGKWSSAQVLRGTGTDAGEPKRGLL